eukprot:11866836-Alexandrium_andersonii.AAC.1
MVSVSGGRQQTRADRKNFLGTGGQAGDAGYDASAFGQWVWALRCAMGGLVWSCLRAAPNPRRDVVFR